MRVEREPAFGCFGQGSTQHIARVGRSGLSVGSRDVAKHARGRVDLPSPRQHLKRCGVRVQQHIGLVHTRQSLDGGSVDSKPLGKRALDLGGCQRNVLEGSRHVGEPQPNELHTAFLNGAEHKLLLLVHGTPSPLSLRY